MSCKYTAYGTYVCTVEKFEDIEEEEVEEEVIEVDPENNEEILMDSMQTAVMQTAAPTVAMQTSAPTVAMNKPAQTVYKGSYADSCINAEFRQNGTWLLAECKDAKGQYRKTDAVCNNKKWRNVNGYLECE